MYRGSPVGVVHSNKPLAEREDPADLYRGYYPAMSSGLGRHASRRAQQQQHQTTRLSDLEPELVSESEPEPEPAMQPPARVRTKPQASVLLRAPQATATKADSVYSKLLQDDIPARMTGVPKHVLKVREVTDLILFVAVAAAGIMLFDVTTKFFFSIARKKCP